MAQSEHVKDWLVTYQNGEQDLVRALTLWDAAEKVKRLDNRPVESIELLHEVKD